MKTIYDDIIPILNDKHLYPQKTIRMTKQGEVCEGLWLESIPILAQSKLKKVREALPDGFVANWLPNISEIHITIKK